MKVSNLLNATGRARLLALLITLLMAFSVVACGDDDNGGDKGNNAADAGTDADNGGTDADNGGTDVDNGGTDADNGGTDADNGGTDADNGGTDADNGGTDADNGGTDADNGGTDADNGGTDADNGGTDADNGDDGLTCGEIYSCIVTCQSDEACVQDCFADGSVAGQNQLEAAMTCITDNCAEDDSAACQQANCQAELDACEGLGESSEGAACIDNCTGEGQGTCAAGLTCVDLTQDGSVKGCINVQGEQYIIPEGATQCGDDASVCTADQTCLPYGGGSSAEGTCLPFCTSNAECPELGDPPVQSECITIGSGQSICGIDQGNDMISVAVPESPQSCDGTPGSCPENYGCFQLQ